jgi:uncharacterized protein YjdB
MNSLRKLILFTLIGILSLVSTKALSDDSDKLVYDCSNIKRADYVSGTVKDKGYWEIIESVLYIERRNDVNISAIPDYTSEFTPWGRYAPCLKQVAVSHLKDYKIIGDRAFYNCSQMYGLYDYFDSSADKNRVNIPSGIERIGARAFHLCYNAVIHADFRDRPTPPLVGNNAFLGVPVEKCSLIIPAGSLSAYKATQWGEFGNITVLSECAKFGMDTLWLYEGDKYYLENVIPDDVTDRSLRWYIVDPDVAIVSGEEIVYPSMGSNYDIHYSDPYGEAIVYALAVGKSNITAETSYGTPAIYLSNGRFYWKEPGGDQFTVVVKKRLATNVNLNKSEILLNIGDNCALTNDIYIPTEYPESVIYTKDVAWSSDKPYVAIVDGNGVVTARSSGQAVITATGDGGIKGECTVTVAAPVSGIKMDRKFLYMKSEESEKLTAFRLPESSYTDIEWSSSNTQIAIVGDTGVVTALSEGSAIITAKTVQGGFTATCEILVRKSDDAGLKSLTVQGITLEPAFNPDVFNYTGSVLRGSNIRITAEANHTKALVTGTGQKTLLQGADTVFHISVTAEDKTVKEYLISVIIDNPQGTCGDNVSWTLREGDTLYIDGSGAMADWNDNSAPSWYNYISAVKSIVIDGVTHIGNYAFQGCVNAASVTIAPSVESIGNYAFYGCSRLSSIDLANITIIGHMAFAHCSDLASVIIPESLEEFGHNVFYGCRVKSVTNKRQENPQIIDRSVFTNINGGFSAGEATLCVYLASIDAYKEAAVWKDFGTITTIENHDATLKSITVTVGADTFPLAIVGYDAEIKIDATVSSLTIDAVPNDSSVTNIVGTGLKNNLPAGDTVFIIKVTAVNTITVNEYAVKIKRPGRDATLKSLSVSKHTEAGIEPVGITPAFDRNTLDYKVELPGSVSSITIEAEPSDSLALVNYTGRKDNITPGNTIFHIIVRGENRSITQEYHVKVTKQAGVMPNGGTGISNPGTATAQVYVAGGILHIESPVSERIDIYSVTGNRLYSVEKPAGKTTFAGTASGRILIVKGSSGWVKKIVD